MNERPIAPNPLRLPAFLRSVVPALLLLWMALPGAPRALAAAGGDPGRTATGAAPAADATLAFSRGVLAFHDGDFDAARTHFGEAVRLAPEDGTARYWLGMTELNLGRAAEAARAIRESLDAPRPPAVPAEELRATLAEAERRAATAPTEAEPLPAPGWIGDVAVLPEVRPWDLRISLSAGTDSNPNLLGDDLVLATPDGEVVDGEESDTVVLADLRLGLQRVGGADQDGNLSYGLAFRGSHAAYSDFDYLDVTHLDAVAQLAWGRDPAGIVTGPLGYSRVPSGRTPVSVLVQVGVSRDELDGAGSSEISADGVLGGATLIVREGGWGQTQLEGSWRDLDFDDDALGPLAKSGDVLRGGVAQYFYLGRRNRYLRLDVSAGQRDAGASRDASLTGAGAELSLPLARRWTLYASGSYTREEYDEPESNLFTFAGPAREDDVVRVGGSLVWRALERLFVTGRVTRIDHDIDLDAPFGVPDLSYERTVATLGVSWIF
ncbi:MAG: tetratricopeptide repeat protein [Acidobacteriota bacterium]|jgi:hypothetical protein